MGEKELECSYDLYLVETVFSNVNEAAIFI